MRLLFFLVGALPLLGQTTETFGGTLVLSRPTASSVTVNGLFPAAQDSVYVEYGTSSGALDKQSPLRQGIRPNVPLEEVLSGLAPNTRYFYRVRYKRLSTDPLGASAEHTFMTQRPKGSSFTFTVVADSHLFTPNHCLPARYALTMANARADNPDFHFDLGDTFRSDTIVNNQATLTYDLVLNRAIAHRPFFNVVSADAPLFLVNGNHDSEFAYYTQPASRENPSLPLWATNARLSVYSNPVPDSFYTGDKTVYPDVIKGGLRQSYYAFEWGDALFVVLDPYWNMSTQNGTWSTILGDAQYFWLRDTLRGSKAKYKFVFQHHINGQGRGGVESAVQYEWGGTDPRRQQTFAQARPNWDKPVHQLMVETGVTVYFQGHDHLYAKSVLDGIAYVTAPMPGAGPPFAADYFPGNETIGNFDAYDQSLTLPNSGHLRVNVAPTGVTVDYVLSRLPNVDPGGNRNVAYRFTAANSAPQPLAIVSAASYFEGVLAPSSIATAFGRDIPATGAAVTVKDASGALIDAQVLNAAAGQLSFVVPAGAANGLATVSIQRNGATLASATTNILRPAPSLFSANASSYGVAAATAFLAKADGTRVPVPVFNCRAGAGCTTTPMSLGSPEDQLILTLYGTGFGTLTPADLFVHIGGVKAEVLYAGPQGAFLGLDQINLRIPRSAAGSGESGIVLAVREAVSNVVLVNIQ